MNPPDRKEREIAEHYRSLIARELFDERHVAFLFITLRNALSANEVLFELGSFVAHRRRTKGTFHRFFEAGVYASRTEHGLRVGMNAQPIYSIDEILGAINQALTSLEIDALPHSVGEGVVLCLISLLQDVTFADRNNQELGRIFFAFNAAEIFAMAAVRVAEKAEQLVPVLRVPEPLAQMDGPTGEVARRDGLPGGAQLLGDCRALGWRAHCHP